MRFEDRGERRPLTLGERNVVIDQIDVRVDHGELGVGRAPQHVRCARRVVLEQLPEEHIGL